MGLPPLTPYKVRFYGVDRTVMQERCEICVTVEISEHDGERAIVTARKHLPNTVPFWNLISVTVG